MFDVVFVNPGSRRRDRRPSGGTVDLVLIRKLTQSSRNPDDPATPNVQKEAISFHNLLPPGIAPGGPVARRDKYPSFMFDWFFQGPCPIPVDQIGEAGDAHP